MSTLFIDYLSSLLIALSIAWILTILLTSNSRARKSSKPPPGPFRLPIIGNILALGPKPHQSLAKLSQKYGPVMSLKLGTITTVVISSPDTAKAVLLKHGVASSSRKIPTAVQTVRHDEFSIGWIPVGEQWRKLRKICREQMFSASRLDASQGVRADNLDRLRAHVKACRDSGMAVDVGESAFTTSLNLLSAMLFSFDLATFDGGSSHELKEVVWGVMKCFGRPNLADYFPMLKRADPQGILKESRYYFGRLFHIFDRIIDERLESRSGSRTQKDDFLEVLLHHHELNELRMDDIKHLLFDLFIAGTDTTSSTVEWAMAELLRRPNKLSRLRKEINDVIIETNEQLQESDIHRLPYLRAVVKETFRLHPVAPFLIPHKADADIEINGYTIPNEAQILVNVWTIGRDSSLWTEPDKFVPERFLRDGDGDFREINFRGQDFELIPFGAGRRICPGLPLGYRMVHLMLATLVGNFGWRVEEEIDMDEKFGITLQKAVPLKAIPV